MRNWIDFVVCCIYDTGFWTTDQLMLAFDHHLSDATPSFLCLYLYKGKGIHASFEISIVQCTFIYIYIYIYINCPTTTCFFFFTFFFCGCLLLHWDSLYWQVQLINFGFCYLAGSSALGNTGTGTIFSTLVINLLWFSFSFHLESW